MKGLYETSNWQSREAHGVRSICKNEPGCCAVIICNHCDNIPQICQLGGEMIWTHDFRDLSPRLPCLMSWAVVRHIVAEACGR